LDSTIGSSCVQSDHAVNSLHCVGERISSVRTLLKMPCQMLADGAVTNGICTNVIPYVITCGTVVGAVNTRPIVHNDTYSKFACCYLYSRGGVRLKFLDVEAVTSTFPGLIFLLTGSASTPLLQTGIQHSPNDASGTSNFSSRLNMPVVYYRASFSAEVQVPQYSRYHSRVNSECVANAANEYGSFVNLAPQVFVTRTKIGTPTVGTSVLRSTSDDSNFGGFLSIPPMAPVVGGFN